MSTDGAQQGISAGDALDVILGGADPDDVGESTTSEMARRVMGTHLLDVGGDYGRMGDWTAHMYVDTAILLGYFPEDIYAATKERLGKDSTECEELMQISGFMHGWAENAARAIMELPEVPNPAVIQIAIPTAVDLEWMVTYDDVDTAELVRLYNWQGQILDERMARQLAENKRSMGHADVVVWSKEPEGMWVER